MTDFETASLAHAPQVVAPDGSDVRILPALTGGSMIHFTLALGATSRAVEHRTIEELWYVVSGRGDLWRATGEHDETVALQPGVAVTIPVRTRFQFRATGREPLTIVGVTMPPWPGDDEAIAVDGPWEPTV
jgi:mannose-6-phosphate isomerase-like protein (cupin superfamily)